MLRIFILIGLSCAGMFASADPVRPCNPEKCREMAPPVRGGVPEHMLPGKDKLNEMCPSFLSALACYNDSTGTCLGHDMFDAVEFWQEEMNGVLADMYRGISDMFADLCNVNSDLHKRYTAHVDCARRAVFGSLPQSTCVQQAVMLQGSYALSSGSEDAGKKNKEQGCLRAAHMLSCAIHEIYKECGEEARATAVEMMKRSKVPKVSCNIQNVPSIVNEYLELLELKEEEREIFAKTFDVIARK